MLEKLLDRAERHGPWILLLVYYFFYLDGQMKEIIRLLQEQNQILALIFRLTRQ